MGVGGGYNRFVIPPGYDPGYPSGHDGGFHSGFFPYPGNGGTSDAAGEFSNYTTICGGYNSDGAVACQQMHENVGMLWSSHKTQYPNPEMLSGDFVCEFQTQPDGAGCAISTWITKDGKWYGVANASYTLVDNCGTTEVGTYDAPSGENLFTHVDWPNLVSITLNSPLPSCVGDPNVASAPSPNPLSGNTPNYIYGTDFTPLIKDRCYAYAFSPNVIIEDCSSSTAGAQVRADVFPGTNTLGVAWVNAAGALITAVHRSPLAFVAKSSQGWETNQVLETAGASSVGYQFLRSGRAVVDYQLSGAGRYRTNDRQGAGPAAAWSASAFKASVGAAAAGRSPYEDWRFVLSGAVWALSTSRDNQGVNWSGGTNASIAETGSSCGGAWTGTGYGLLYNRTSDGHAVYRSTAKPNDWSAAVEIDTGSSLTAAGMQKAASGSLVGLLYDAGTQRCRAIRSRNRGAAWELLPITTTIPKLAAPPALVVMGSALLAVWQTGDQAQFAVSVDEGQTWA